ncbi:MAG: APC family permease [Kofleriaceae bacterium]
MSEAPALRRVIGRWQVVALTVNVVIGAGIFGLPSKLYQAAGAWSLLGLLGCAVLVTLMNLAIFELAGRFTTTGGPYRYAAEAYGPSVGFAVGWLAWLMRVTSMAAVLGVLCDYLGGIVPALEDPVPRAVLVTAIITVLAVINIAGVRLASIAGSLFTVGKLVPLVVLAVVGLWFIEPSRLAPVDDLAIGSVARAAMLCIFAFTGFETATILAGEMRDPRRDLPFALFAMTGIVLVVYGLLLVVSIGTVPALGESPRPLVDAASAIAGKAGIAIVTIGALVSVSGALIALMTAVPRLLFAMAESGDLPRVLATVHPKRGTPQVAIIATALAALVLSLTGTFVWLVVIATTIRLSTYVLTSLAALVFRHRDGRSLWTLPAGIPVVMISLVLTGWMFASTHLDEIPLAALLCAAGFAIRALTALSTRGYRRGRGLS